MVVTLVEVFEHRGEDLGLLFWQVDAFGVGFEKLASAAGGEEGGEGENVFMSSEEALFGSDTDGDDGRGEGAALHGVRTELYRCFLAE